MSVGIATMGFFNPAPCVAVGPGDVGGIGGGGGGYYDELMRKKPIIIVSRVESNKKIPTIEITEVETT